jgi:cytochrome c oxidase assembly protein subunit 11
MSAPREKSNRRIAGGLAAFVVCMIGLSFAAVPLYRAFCAATGYAGTTQRAASGPGKIYPQTVVVRFDANVAPGLSWRFEPMQPETEVHVGETKLAFFRAINKTDEAVTGSAVFHVSPEYMGKYFTKIQCFCFEEQTLGPGEAVEMPVSFFLDPAMLDDGSARAVRDMTLSYTFFRVKTPAPVSGATFAKGRADSPAAATQNPG